VPASGPALWSRYHITGKKGYNRSLACDLLFSSVGHVPGKKGTMDLLRDPVYVEGSDNDIHKCYRIFKERVRRLTPNKIKKQDTEGYFTPQRRIKFFGKEETWNKSIKFEYFSVVIRDNRQHMHVLYFGNWLPHAWLKRVWKERTGDSEIVDIRTTNRVVDDDRRLAGYVLTQYALFQEGNIRFQMSQGWTWRGMVRDWKNG